MSSMRMVTLMVGLCLLKAVSAATDDTAVVEKADAVRSLQAVCTGLDRPGRQLVVERQAAARRVYVAPGHYDKAALRRAVLRANACGLREVGQIDFVAPWGSLHPDVGTRPPMPHSAVRRQGDLLRRSARGDILTAEGVPFGLEWFVGGRCEPFESLSDAQREFLVVRFSRDYDLMQPAVMDSPPPREIDGRRVLRGCRVQFGVQVTLGLAVWQRGDKPVRPSTLHLLPIADNLLDRSPIRRPDD